MGSGPSDRLIRVAVVDDHDVARVGLAGLVRATPDACWVGDADSVAGARRLRQRIIADVVVVDVYLPDGSGLIVCREWMQAQPATRILMLSAWADAAVVGAALDAGAAGYVLKSTRGRTVLQAIRMVADGATILGAGVEHPGGGGTTAGGLGITDDPAGRLNARQREIMGYLAHGWTNQAIAHELLLSEAAVKYHVHNILAVLGVSHRTAVAYWASGDPHRLEAPRRDSGARTTTVQRVGSTVGPAQCAAAALRRRG